MSEEIFKLVENHTYQVVLKVLANDIATIARYPFIQLNYDYIVVTKGIDEHTLMIVYKDGTVYSFEWGDSSISLINDKLVTLRTEVLKFIKSKGINLKTQGYFRNPNESIVVGDTSRFPFHVVDVTPDLVVVKVVTIDTASIARAPYVSAKMDYLTVTRGDTHTLTIIYKDGKTWTTTWGSHLSRLGTHADDRIGILIRQLCSFIISRDGISVDDNEVKPIGDIVLRMTKGIPMRCMLSYGNDSCPMQYFEASSEEDAIKKAKQYVGITGKKWTVFKKDRWSTALKTRGYKKYPSEPCMQHFATVKEVYAKIYAPNKRSRKKQ